jgi:soluble lytic murein transglycosylase-like protein
MAYTTQQIQQMIVDAANQYGVPPNIALGIASHESGFNPNAINSNNPNGTKDWGVMQLNDTTVQTMGVQNPLDPQQNIDAGVQLLSNLLNRYNGDVNSALWAYASGPGNVGPDKTPNTIAQNFINYVTGYGGGSPPSNPHPAPRDPNRGA